MDDDESGLSDTHFLSPQSNGGVHDARRLPEREHDENASTHEADIREHPHTTQGTEPSQCFSSDA